MRLGGNPLMGSNPISSAGHEGSDGSRWAPRFVPGLSSRLSRTRNHVVSPCLRGSTEQGAAHASGRFLGERRRYVRVPLGRRDPSVPEDLLHGAQVYALLNEERRRGVARVVLSRLAHTRPTAYRFPLSPIFRASDRFEVEHLLASRSSGRRQMQKRVVAVFCFLELVEESSCLSFGPGHDRGRFFAGTAPKMYVVQSGARALIREGSAEGKDPLCQGAASRFGAQVGHERAKPLPCGGP